MIRLAPRQRGRKEKRPEPKGSGRNDASVLPPEFGLSPALCPAQTCRNPCNGGFSRPAILGRTPFSAGRSGMAFDPRVRRLAPDRLFSGYAGRIYFFPVNAFRLSVVLPHFPYYVKDYSARESAQTVRELRVSPALRIIDGKRGSLSALGNRWVSRHTPECRGYTAPPFPFSPDRKLPV